MLDMQHHGHTSNQGESAPPPAPPQQFNEPPRPRPEQLRSRKKQRNPLLIPLILVSVLALAMSGLYVFTLIDNARPNVDLTAAVDECTDSPFITVVDDGASVIMDSEGTEVGGADFIDIMCVLTELETPDSILNQINNTRAMDGTQTGSWDLYEATWNYHPSDGASITVTIAND